jgi:hypothetical protein
MMELLESMEEWRDVPGFEGLYKISNLGNIKSLNYRRKGVVSILKQNTSTPYNIIRLYKNEKSFAIHTHRIVADAFLATKPTDSHTIDHINQNKRDNNVSNLRWLDKTEQNLNRTIKSGHHHIICDSHQNGFHVKYKKYNEIIFYKYTKTLEEAIAARDAYLASI